jgi:hypothetical protein
VAVVAVLAIGVAFAVVGLKPQVSVQSGTRTQCTYGHLVDEAIKTMKVPADKAALYGVATKYLTCPRHQEAERLMAQAKAALAKGDKAKAKKLVQQAFAQASDVADPSGLSASLKVARPSGSSGSTSGAAAGGGTGGGADPTGDGVVSPVDLISALPKSLPGYQFVSENRSMVAATRTFRGTTALPQQLVVQVTYVGGETGYDDWFEDRVKLAYSVSPQTVKADGRSVYFATDGQRFAAASWYQGGGAFQVEAAAESGSPAALKSSVLDVIGRMP